MRLHLSGFVAAMLVFGASQMLTAGQTPGGVTTRAAHVAAARAAAGQEHLEIFNRRCSQSAPELVPPAPAAPAAPAQQGPPPRASWYAEPAKVFDNLYFVGEQEYSAWAVTTSEGIIVIDTIFDYSVEEEVIGGLKKLGLDPARIRYVIVSHGHRDHVGGARLLQDRGARIIMSAADWDLLDRATGTWPKPKRDMVATDGQKLTLGDTTLTLYSMPGHTLGTISTIIPLKDGARTHTAAYPGGSGFNCLGNRAAYITPERPDRFWFETYATSIQRFKDLAAKAGADVLITNHTDVDGTTTKVPMLAKRRPGEPHPYVIGSASVQRFLTVAEECAKAGLAPAAR